MLSNLALVAFQTLLSRMCMRQVIYAILAHGTHLVIYVTIVPFAVGGSNPPRAIFC